MIQALLVLLLPFAAAAQYLATWNDGANKSAIASFVAESTTPGGKFFVQPEDRVAVFDFDGTLAVEWPVYSQLVYCADEVQSRVKAGGTEAENALAQKLLALPGDKLAGVDEPTEIELFEAAFSSATGEENQSKARDWFFKARHPSLREPRARLLYAPMLDLVRFLQNAGFKTFIVSAGTSDFIRAFSEELIGVPKENVVGTELEPRFVEGPPARVERTEKFTRWTSGQIKPIEIDRRIGRRPLMAFGNSDADIPMLAYATSGPRRGFGALVHHDDAEREFAYDRKSPVGPLDKGLD
ncbi:MAG: HAD family hydrolase, partial [Elusimicrobia bacterium]|nr:HAD family hydrolase [Elusimicrobiota bacterium]